MSVSERIASSGTEWQREKQASRGTRLRCNATVAHSETRVGAGGDGSDRASAVVGKRRVVNAAARAFRDAERFSQRVPPRNNRWPAVEKAANAVSPMMGRWLRRLRAAQGATSRESPPAFFSLRVRDVVPRRKETRARRRPVRGARIGHRRGGAAAGSVRMGRPVRRRSPTVRRRGTPRERAQGPAASRSGPVRSPSE